MSKHVQFLNENSSLKENLLSGSITIEASEGGKGGL